jgi:hypothetical protein
MSIRDRIRDIMKSSASRWLLLLPLCVFGALIAAFAFGWFGWVQSWIGALFKATSGAALGFTISRVCTKLDLSAIRDPFQKTEAAKSQALLIVGMAVAVAAGF